MNFDINGFGRRLKHYRILNHMTQEALAEQVETATSSISHLENGTHTPSLKTLIKLCNVLNIGVDDLLADSLPIRNSYLDKDIEELLSDCKPSEKQIIKDIIITTKKAIRANKYLLAAFFVCK